MVLKIKDLLFGLDIIDASIVNHDAIITDISYNSKNIQDGSAFVCIKGFRVDGHDFIPEAIEKGAVLIIVDQFYNIENLKGKANVVKTNNTRKALSVVSNNFFGHPSKSFNLIGVTGTNGKTSTTFMIKSILEKNNQKVGLIGTIKNMIGQKELKTERTTPESYDLQKLFFEMKNENVNSVVMEVSSHSLELNRVDGCDFDVGVFTNLTQDHLDFHENMENYFNAKLKLFKMSKKSVVNIDDNWGQKIVSILPESITYSTIADADVVARNIKIHVNSCEFDLCIKDEVQKIRLNIPGIFSVYNALSAASCAYSLGVPINVIKEGLEAIKSIPGRFEIVESNEKFTVVIDYAHTPDGLLNLLKTVDQVANGRKVLLFGCGGDRDRTKRPVMGKIAGSMADFVIVTSDNPRSEDPFLIIEDILQGLSKTDAQYVVIPDRFEAIRYAIVNAKENDFIVLAGKGHEDYQILKDKTIHFDEREVVNSVLKEIRKDEP